MRIGDYEVEERLAEGGMAEVLLGRGQDGRRVVLKRALRPADAMTQRRLRDEGKLGLRLNGTGFAETLLVLNDDSGAAVLALEWVDGVPLEGLWKVAPLSPWMVAKLGSEVAAAIAMLHDVRSDDGRALGAVHRDLSSRNVLLERGGRARVIDLGCALFNDDERSARTEAGNVLGTLRYLAPEVFENAKACQASDVWSIGVLLLEAALGRPVFKGSPRDVAAAVFFRDPFVDVDVQALDSRLLEVLRRALRRNPAARPSAGRLAEDLAVLADEIASESAQLRALVDRARSAIAAGLIRVGTSHPSPAHDEVLAAEATTRDGRHRPAMAIESTTEPDRRRRADSGVDDDDDDVDVDGPTMVDADRAPAEGSITARMERRAPLSLEVDTPVRPMSRRALFDEAPSMPSEASVAGVFAPREEVPIRRMCDAGLVPVHTIRLVDDDVRSVPDVVDVHRTSPLIGIAAPPVPVDPQRAEATTIVVRHERPDPRREPHLTPVSILVVIVVAIGLVLADAAIDGGSPFP